jgi:C-methyltransferase-like protein
VRALLHEEEERGLRSARPYEALAENVTKFRVTFVGLLRELKARGKRIAAYGAPAKGNTLLNYCGIGRDLIEFTVDRNPHKQGMLLPGSHIPILPSEELNRRMPDYAVVLPWNIADEIVAQESAYLARGGQLIVPIPELRIIGSTGPVGVARPAWGAKQLSGRAVATVSSRGSVCHE